MAAFVLGALYGEWEGHRHRPTISIIIKQPLNLWSLIVENKLADTYLSTFLIKPFCRGLQL